MTNMRLTPNTASFAKFIACIVLISLSMFTFQKAARAEVIGLSIPKSGDFSELGVQFETGANLAMQQLGTDHTLFIVDDGCDEDLALLAAQDIKSVDPAIVTGMICNVSALAMANELHADKTPILVAGARSVRLIKDRDREQWNLWRMSPGDDAAAEKIVQYILANLKDKPFALVDDGTIYGRSLTDAIRLRLNDVNMAPQFADTFRAAQSTQAGMLRRLQRSGVETAFIAAASTEDLMTIAKDHKALGINTQLVLTEHLASLPYSQEASAVSDNIMIVMQPPFERITALDTILQARGLKPSKALYDGYTAIEVALSALAESKNETTNKLATQRIETVTGAVEFNNEGKNINNPYKLYTWRDGALQPLDMAGNL